MPQAATATRVRRTLPMEQPSLDQPIVDQPLFESPRPVPSRQAEEALRQVPHTDDIIDYTMRCLMALAPQTGEEIVRSVERQVRDVFARNKVYVAARSGEGKAPRNAQIRREFLAGERVAMLARKYGLSEAMVWIIVRDVR